MLGLAQSREKEKYKTRTISFQLIEERKETLMKKLMKKTLLPALILILALAFAACGNAKTAEPASVTEVGTYKYDEIKMYPFQGATLINASFNSLTLYSDNTFTLTNIADTCATSDFESLHRPAIIDVVAYGTYEVVSTDSELHETTVKITSVKRVINGNTDTDGSSIASDVKDWVITNSGAIGTEIIVNDDDHTMTNVSILPFRLGENPDPQQEGMAQMFWGSN